MIQHISIRVPWHDNGWNGIKEIGKIKKNFIRRTASLKVKIS